MHTQIKKFSINEEHFTVFYWCIIAHIRKPFTVLDMRGLHGFQKTERSLQYIPFSMDLLSLIDYAGCSIMVYNVMQTFYTFYEFHKCLKCTQSKTSLFMQIILVS